MGNMREYMQLAELLADVLDIDVPSIREIDGAKLPSPTQMGAYEPSSNTLYLKKGLGENEAHMTIAHEMRHIWQLWNDVYDEIWDPLPLTGDKRAYNLQPHEIDANAFAAVIMGTLYKMAPLFTGVDPDVRDRINASAKEIVKELNRILEEKE